MNSCRSRETGRKEIQACSLAGLLGRFLFANNVRPGLNTASASFRGLTFPRRRANP